MSRRSRQPRCSEGCRPSRARDRGTGVPVGALLAAAVFRLAATNALRAAQAAEAGELALAYEPAFAAGQYLAAAARAARVASRCASQFKV